MSERGKNERSKSLGIIINSEQFETINFVLLNTHTHINLQAHKLYA